MELTKKNLIKQKYLKTKNKSWFLAKMFLSKKSNNNVYDFSEHMRIMNQLKKYEQEDYKTLNNVFEYLLDVDKIASNTTIYKIILEANNQVVENKFNKKETKPANIIDLMKYL